MQQSQEKICEQSDNFNNEIENIRKYQTEIKELKNAITELNNSIEGLNSRIDEAEEKKSVNSKSGQWNVFKQGTKKKKKNKIKRLMRFYQAF